MKTNIGDIPVRAIVKGLRGGTEELHTKSFPTLAKTPATIGSSDSILIPYTDELTFGDREKFIT
jgi:hypothetical protein